MADVIRAECEAMTNGTMSEDQRVHEARDWFEGAPVSRPPFWSGFCVVPQSIEFWTRDPHRLHERILFDRRDASWVRALLFP